jgi:2,3-dihydroxyphenylpropionate 1,2-dioxygenase
MKRQRIGSGLGSASSRVVLVLSYSGSRDIFGIDAASRRQRSAVTEKRPMITSSVIGGAMLPHAPQFFTMPETEDKKNAEHVRTVAAEIGEKLRALKPDLWIIFSNDHAEQFFHNSAPPFTVHVGGEASGGFAGRRFHWKIPSEIGFEIVRQLYRQNFDPAFTSTAKIDYAIGIPLTHLGHTDPVLPIYVNAYLPPQPAMERCYAFGQAIARIVTTLGLKMIVLASGGMSHFPGTDRYSNPELNWDKRVLEKLTAGNLKSLIGYDEAELDDTGNIELRCWACAAGALGERKPDLVSMDPSWHHNYASLGWTGGLAETDHAAHYPAIKPELVELTSALHELAHDAERRAQYLANAPAFADRFQLPADQREALIKLDLPAIVKMGAHPLVPFLAELQIRRLLPPA